jgi:hypothetical protein
MCVYIWDASIEDAVIQCAKHHKEFVFGLDFRCVRRRRAHAADSSLLLMLLWRVSAGCFDLACWRPAAGTALCASGTLVRADDHTCPTSSERKYEFSHYEISGT